MLRRIPQRVVLAAVTAALALGLAVPAYVYGFLWPYELKTVDYRFAIRGAQAPPPEIVDVAVDDVTFSELGLRWPFNRAVHARVLDRILRGHPRAVAYDVQFTERSGRDRASTLADNALVRAAERTPGLALAATEVDSLGRANVFGGKYLKIGARAGNASLVDDRDGVVRRVPYQLAGLESFGVVAAERYLGRAIRFPGGRSQWIDFAGPPGTVRTVSFSRVYLGRIPAGVFRGKLVVVGPASPTLLALNTAAADGQPMGADEVLANVAATALRGFPLRSAPRGVNVALIVLLSLLVPLASLRLRGWRPLVLAAASAAALLGGAQLAFDRGRIVAITYPLVALVVSTAGALIVQYVVEAVERKTTHDVFSRFVPEAVVDKVLARTDEHLRLGGEQVVGTVMFTDLRGFTSFSERLPASEVIDLLNHYLSEMSDAILANGGTLVSYAGDGIMAVFGAPLAQPDHADRAVATAREMLAERLPRFNEWLHALGFERGFNMGIGLNTGPFMSGNVGSERRLEYTAIGDTINAASRLQDLTKGTPYALLLAESTRAALAPDAPELLFVEEAHVRGREGAIRLWTLADPAVLKQEWQSEKAAV